MDLLPSKTSDFSSKSYWDAFFTRSKAFEWYGDLKDFSSKLPRTGGSLEALVLGCGNSKLSKDVADARLASKVTSLDFSDLVIDEMRRRYAGDERLDWIVGDFLDLPKEWDGKFAWVFDKGGLDALLTDAQQAKKGRRMLSEAARVLAKDGGVYVLVSLLQAHVLDCVLDSFAAAGPSTSTSFHLDVTPFVPASPTKLLPFLVTVVHSSQSKLTVRNFPANMTRDQIKRAVEDEQRTFAAKLRIASAPLVATTTTSTSRTTFALGPDERYTLHVIDSGLPAKQVKIPFGALVVPQGAENQHAFGKEAGQAELARGNGIARLVVVHLGRGHDFSGKTTEDVQRDVSGAILELKPKGLPDSYRVPFLAVASDLGERKEVARVTSALSGTFVVEDVLLSGDPRRRRRLVFLSAPLDVQSECMLATDGSCDLDTLAFELHQAMTCSFRLAPSSSATDGVVLLGLGGGGLAAYLARNQPEIASIDAVELDPAVVSVAREWFDLKKVEPKVTIHVADAMAFLKEKFNGGDGDEKRRVRGVFIDVDAKELAADDSGEAEFPPREYLSEETLKWIRDAVVSPSGGFLALNLGCRDPDARKRILARFASVFSNVVAFDMSEMGDGNLVLVGTVGTKWTTRGQDNSEALRRAVASDELAEIVGVVTMDGTVVSLEVEEAASTAADGSSKGGVGMAAKKKKKGKGKKR